MSVLFGKAAKTKKRYQHICCSVESLISRIGTDKEFKRADNSENKGILEKHLASLKTIAEGDDFVQLQLVSTPAALKKKYGEDRLIAQLTNFIALDTKLAAFEADFDMVVARTHMKKKTVKVAAVKGKK